MKLIIDTLLSKCPYCEVFANYERSQFATGQECEKCLFAMGKGLGACECISGRNGVHFPEMEA